MARKSELARRLSAVAMAAVVAGSSIVSDISGITAFASESTTATLLKGGGDESSGFRHTLLEAVMKNDSSITTEDDAAKAIKEFKPYFQSGSESTAPSDLETNWTIVSNGSGGGKAYVLYQNGIIWYWSDSPTTYLSKNSAGMFYQLPNLKEVDLSRLDATQAYNMQLMFSGDTSLTTVTGIDYSNTINVQGLFQNCSSLTTLDMSTLQADVLDDNGMVEMLTGSGVTTITLDSDFDFVSKTGLSGNWTKEDDDSVVWTIAELESLYDGDSTSEGIPNAGTYVKTDKTSTKSEDITESASEYYEATKVTDDASVYNIWNIEFPTQRFTAFCIDAQVKDGGSVTTVGYGAPYGYYKKDVATIQNLKNGTTRREKDVTGSGLNSDVMSTEAYLNSDNYGYEPLGSNMVEALTALVYYGPKVYGGTDGIINTKGEYDKLQSAIWHFTNHYSDTWNDESLWSNYHYSDIPEEYRNSTKLYIYVSQATQQNLVAIETEIKTYKIGLIKTDASGSTLAGAKLQISGTDIYGNTYTNTLEETKAKTIQSVDLKPGNYKVSEVQVPSGYRKASVISFSISKDGVVTSGKTTYTSASVRETQFAAAINVVDLYNTEFEISKQDITTSEEIAGAKLKITGTRDQVASTDYTLDAEENVEITPITWTSEAGKSKKVNLQPGSYTLTETTAPDGYSTATSIDFKVVLEDGKLVLKQDGKTVDKIVMKDEALPEETHEVKISKQDIAGDELAGAMLQIFNKDGEKVEEFKSKTEPTTFYLTEGTYTLKETISPDDTLYTISSDVTFKVDSKGKVTIVGNNGSVSDNTVIMTDVYVTHKVKISKKNIAGNEIDGAKLTLSGKTTTGIEVEEISWTSKKDTDHYVEIPEGTYTLTETTAPAGYEKSESITFTVTDEGKVSVNEKTSDSVVMTDEYKAHDVVLSKVDVAGNEIKDAVIEVTGTTFDGESYEASYTSDGTKHTLSVPQGSYTMTEKSAPEGYEKAESINFTVDTDGKVTVDNKEVSSVVMTDDYKGYTVYISKQNTSGSEIDGAKITITGLTTNGSTVEDVVFTTSKKDAPHEFFLPAGTYTLIETTAPDGYKKSEQVKFTLDDKGNVTLVGTNGSVDGKTVIMTDDYNYNKVKVAKVNIAGAEVEGAVLTITGKTFDGETIEPGSWTSKNGEDHYEELPAGTYTLTETTAPSGYVKSESITFTVDKTGAVTVDGKDQNGTITMTDKYEEHNVALSKVDVAGNELAGAKITVKGTTFDGSTFEESYTSDGKKHTMNVPQGSYTMTETTAPDGFEKAESIAFTVDANGKVTTSGKESAAVVMTDKTKSTTVIFKKVDSNSKLLKGAEIKITGKDITGKEITAITYTSTESEAYKATLAPGSYTMEETKAPDGYEKANSISFTVEKDLTVKIGDKTVTEIVMTDVSSTKSATVNVSKTGVDSKGLSGAKLVVYYTGSDGTQKTAASWTTDGNKKSLTLEGGYTYTLHEAEAPAGYLVADDIKFTVVKDGTVTVDGKKTSDITMADKYTTVIVKKVDGDSKNVSGAKLQVKDSSGNVVESWTTDGSNHTMKAVLKAGVTYTLHEESAPDGYETAADISFTVQNSEKEQVLTMTDKKVATTDTQKNKNDNSSSGSSDNNKKTTTSQDKTTTTTANTTSTDSKTPATGDVLFPFMLVGLAAVAGGVGLLFYTKKRRKQQ